MTWTLNDIRAAFMEAQQKGATHLIVAYDSFDGENYPIFVMEGDPRNQVPSNGDRVDECYRIALGWEAQAGAKRVQNWDWDEPQKPFTAAADVKLHTNLYLSNGVMLPYSIEARPDSLGRPEYDRPAEEGEEFISLSDLEELSATRTLQRYMNFSRRAGVALEQAGWATPTTGGSYVATEAFQEDTGKVFSELADLFDPLWDTQKHSRAKSIVAAMTDSERAEVKAILCADD